MIAWDCDLGRVRGMSEAEREQIHNQDQSGQQAWGRKGVAVGLMRDLKCTLYAGEVFGKAQAALVPDSEDDLPALWALCSEPEFNTLVRQLDHNIIVANGTLTKIHFDVNHWRSVAASKFPEGLPAPHSNNPTQWLFTGHPYQSDCPLHVAVARLAGFRWPRQTGSAFRDSPPLVPDGLEPHADDDGIVPLSALRGEQTAAERLYALLADAYADDWSVARLSVLLGDVGFAGRSLDDWLRDGFFEQHCALFHGTPFLWHLWDGTRNGFHIVVNYHRLAAPGGVAGRTLEKVVYSYLSEYIDLQRHGVHGGAEGAEGRLAAAEHLRDELLKIVEGAPPYDLFARWKPLREQAIGWEPDIDDGVRINIRPFMAARTLNGKPILRTAPKINWGKDRGKEPLRPIDDYPWFWGWDGSAIDFEGDPTVKPQEYGKRWNDVHHTRRFKQAARDRHTVGVAK